jgi:hypothetical protein
VVSEAEIHYAAIAVAAAVSAAPQHFRPQIRGFTQI